MRSLISLAAMCLALGLFLAAWELSPRWRCAVLGVAVAVLTADAALDARRREEES